MQLHCYRGYSYSEVNVAVTERVDFSSCLLLGLGHVYQVHAGSDLVQERTTMNG